MADWKDALAALGAQREDTTEAPREDVARKKRVGVVYSTNPDFAYADDTPDEPSTLPPQQQRLRLQMERAGRGGKTVTIVRGFVGTDTDVASLCKLLKTRLGVGGAVKHDDGEQSLPQIVIQGDHRARILDILHREGYSQAK